MGRSLKTRVPCHPEKLLPRTPDISVVRKRERQYRENMTANYNRRHKVVMSDSFAEGDTVGFLICRKRELSLKNTQPPDPSSSKLIVGQSEEIVRCVGKSKTTNLTFLTLLLTTLSLEILETIFHQSLPMISPPEDRHGQ